VVVPRGMAIFYLERVWWRYIKVLRGWGKRFILKGMNNGEGLKVGDLVVIPISKERGYAVGEVVQIDGSVGGSVCGFRIVWVKMSNGEWRSCDEFALRHASSGEIVDYWLKRGGV